MPPDFDDSEDDREPRRDQRAFHSERFGKKRGPWWWPANKAGRIFLGTGVLVVLGALTAAGVTLKHYLERDARFRIAGTGNIQATGLTEVSRGQMLPVFGEDIGRNIFFVPLSERRKQLEQIPWVERATVMRLLPDQIRVSVVERKPVAFTRHGQQIDLVDANGVLLAMAPATMAAHHYSFPVLTGIDPGDPAGARKERMAVYQRMMDELDAGGKHNSEQISEIDLTDPQDARVLMPEQGTDILAHFGEDDFLERYERFQAHIAEWKQQYPHLASVDLRYDNQVVLQMTSGKQASGANGGDAASAPTPSGPSITGDEKKPAGTAPQAKKAKPGQSKKHAADKRAALNKGKRNPATKTRPAAAPTITPGMQAGN
jgi:cell division protein FtsQ